MAERVEPVEEGSTTEQLLALAIQLEEAAIRADRLDVSAKANEVIALLANANTEAGGNAQRHGNHGPANAFIRVLDGLGF